MLPSNRMLVIMVAGLLPLLAALVIMLIGGPVQPASVALPLLVLLNGSLLVFALRDVGWLLRWRQSSPLEISRQVKPTAGQGTDATAELIIDNHGRRPIRIEINDSPPADFQVQDEALPLKATVMPGTRTRLSYRYSPLKRGNHNFGDLHLRMYGPLSLVLRQIRLPQSQTVRVLPDVQAVQEGRYMVSRVQHNELSRRSRLRGEIGEFHHLRGYVNGDDTRLIDWKATARRRELVVRTLEPQRNQNVLILLDAGRLMTGEIGRLNKFDWAVRATLGLAGAAVASGDAVGLLVFSRQLGQFLAPDKGEPQLKLMAEALAMAETDLLQADYRAALAHAARHLSRRSLIMLITDLGSGADRHDLMTAFSLVLPRHLAVLASIADPALPSIAEASPPDETSLFEIITADEILSDVTAVRQNLQSRGVISLQAQAGNLLEQSVQAYLEIKLRGRL